MDTVEVKIGAPAGSAGSGCGSGCLTLHRVRGFYETAIRAALRDLAADSRRDRFPGPNPVSLDTGHFARVRGERYVVAEKTDGVRYALMCCTLPAPLSPGGPARGLINVCVLVDRALAAYLFPVRHLPRAAYQGTLLDGELVWNRGAAGGAPGWEYVVFDAVSVSGVPVFESSLPRRLEAVERALGVYREAGGRAAGDPARVSVKRFFDTVEQYAAREPTGHAVDGLILTPVDQEIVYGRHMSLFKLKSKHTVDFLVQPDGVGLAVYDSNGGGHRVVARLAGGEPPQAPGAVVECAPRGGGRGGCEWTVVGARTDKNTANDLLTYEKTLLNMAERLTEDDVAPLLRR
jgi:hypothetical protein